MKHFCIIANHSKPDSVRKAGQLRDKIREKGGTALILPTRKEGTDAGEGFTDVSGLPSGTEAALVLGGDGTVIQAARELADRAIPLMGINLGTVGFLTEIELEQVEQALDMLFRDRFRIEERLMLTGAVRKKGEEVYRAQALNDIVITRSGYSRIMSVQVTVNGQVLTNYRGDGVILSTPTGSTAYNLSAGGPVILPEAQAFVVTPICAHSWEIRSIVASADDRIRIEIARSKKSQPEEAIVSFDGNAGILLETGDIVEVWKAEQQTRFLKIENRGVLENLRDKIGYGQEEGV